MSIVLTDRVNKAQNNTGHAGHVTVLNNSL